MPVPFFDIHYGLNPQDQEAILERWRQVLAHGRFINGPEVGELEARLADFLGVPHVLACSNGSDALVLALRAAGVEPGDEVILPAFSFFATAGAVARLGAVPVFADIEAQSFNLDRDSALAKLSSKTKAVLPVHLFGRPTEIGPLREALETAAGRGIAMVEDAAQAVGASSLEGPCGGLGDTAAFSCFPTKNLGALGDAGFVATGDPDRAEHMRRLREHGGSQTYFHDEVGYNFRLDTLQAAALSERLPRLLEWTAARQVAAQHYEELFHAAGLETRLELPERLPGHVFHQYVIRSRERDALKEAMQAAEVGAAIYYPLPLHLQPCFAELGQSEGSLPECERAAREVLALPIHPGIAPEQRAEVVETIRRFYA